MSANQDPYSPITTHFLYYTKNRFKTRVGWKSFEDKYDHETMLTRFSEWEEAKIETAGGLCIE